MNTYVFNYVESINQGIMVIANDYFVALKKLEDADISISFEESRDCEDCEGSGSIDEGIYLLGRMIG